MEKEVDMVEVRVEVMVWAEASEIIADKIEGEILLTVTVTAFVII
jgi:hypothetical protein